MIADVDGPVRDGRSALQDQGLDALALEIDIASEQSIGPDSFAIAEHYGGLDVLVIMRVPTGFTGTDAPVLDIPLATWEGTLQIVLGGIAGSAT